MYDPPEKHVQFSEGAPPHVFDIRTTYLSVNARQPAEDGWTCYEGIAINKALPHSRSVSSDD